MGIWKWNKEKHEYEPYKVPKDEEVILYSIDMDEMIDCTSCFVAIPYGASYTSKLLHNKVGLGYPVCGKCYQKELENNE